MQARKALDSMSSLMINELLAKQTEVTPEMRQMLTASLEMYEQLVIDSGSDRQTRESAADATYRIARIYARLGMEEDNLRQLESAAVQYSRLFADYPAAIEYISRVFSTHRAIVNAEISEGHFARAEEHLKLAEQANSKLKEHFGEVTEYLDNRVAIQYSFSDLYQEQERFTEGEEQLRKAIASQQALIAKSEEDGKVNTDSRGFLASMMQQLGLSLRHQDRFEEARQEYRRAIKILRDLEEHGPLSPSDQRRLGILLNDTGVAWKIEGHLDEAEEYFRQSLDTRKEAAEKYPNDIDQLASLGGLIAQHGKSVSTAETADRIAPVLRK